MNIVRLTFAAIVLFVTSSGLLADELNLATFEKLHAELTSRKEAWQQIPWQTNLLAAREMAFAQEKPLFIWSMDGHPLGCT